MRSRRFWLFTLTTVLIVGLGIGAYVLFFRPPNLEAERLREHVHDRPPVPIVFTSRSEPASFAPAAVEGEGFRYPGQHQWAAREGRLRLLTTDGRVLELTWERQLPDGTTLIDVMSPSVTLDGQKILFAGRKGGSDPGRFRLYEVGIDGSNLRQLTGGPEDTGTTELPPLRYGAGDDQERLPDSERRRVDYDDVDPTDGAQGRIVFASSRTPDLGRGHARRATNLWELDPIRGTKRSLTANRNNDRWPYLTANGFFAFSLWSRNNEVITADGKEVRPLAPGEKGLTEPIDYWLGAIVDQAANPRMAGLVKVPEPVWRPRPLFREAIAYMTWDGPGLPRLDRPEDLAALRVVQAPPELMVNAAHSRPAGSVLPTRAAKNRYTGPTADLEGRPLALATPSPCPDAGVLLAGAVTPTGRAGPTPEAFGIYLADDDWTVAEGTISAEKAGLRLLFDDPDLVDAEAVAIYARKCQYVQRELADDPVGIVQRVLPGGRRYEGPVGTVHADKVFDSFLDHKPGQTTDAGQGPIFGPAPRGSIREVRIFASYRDRFDDPKQPRIPGGWEEIARGPVDPHGGFRFDAPAGAPTVLAGFDAEGRVVRWRTPARDKEGRQADLLYIAGDHYSGIRPGGYHFCTGCHTGHSILDVEDYREQRR